MANILEIANVTKEYTGKRALHNVSLNIPVGSIYGLLGPNGAGKTSLIRIINRITQPDSGTVLFNGHPLTAEDVRHIGYLPEERGLYKKMKVLDQVIYFARLRGLSAGEARSKADNWLQKFDLTAWRNKKVQELSKGMQQKVQFIITVLHEPKLIILDEPFSGFDPINADLLTKEILNLRDGGSTILYSTHRMESVEQLCDYIALINQSEKILDGSVSGIKGQYKSNLYRAVLGSPYTSSNTMISIKTAENLANGRYHYTISCNAERAANTILADILPKAQVFQFEEIVPSIHDIFISKVTNKELYA